MDRVETAFVSRLAGIFATIVLLAPLLLEAQAIPENAVIRARLTDSVTTKSANIGDLVSAIVLTDGGVIHGRVAFVQRASLDDNGWLRLMFDRIEPRSGVAANIQAFGVFTMKRPNNVLDYGLAIGGLAALGAILGGRTWRLAAGIGGAVAGLTVENIRHGSGHDLTLHRGQILLLRR